MERTGPRTETAKVLPTTPGHTEHGESGAPEQRGEAPARCLPPRRPVSSSPVGAAADG